MEIQSTLEMGTRQRRRANDLGLFETTSLESTPLLGTRFDSCVSSIVLPYLHSNPVNPDTSPTG